MTEEVRTLLKISPGLFESRYGNPHCGNLRISDFPSRRSTGSGSVIVCVYRSTKMIVKTPIIGDMLNGTVVVEVL